MQIARVLSIVNFAGLIALVTIAAGRAPETPEILRARALELVDAQGAPYARIAREGNGKTALELFDVTGKRRVTLGISERDPAGAPRDVAALGLMNEDEKPRVELVANDDDFYGLLLMDNDGKLRLLVYTSPTEEGTPGILFADERDKPRAYVGLKPIEGRWEERAPDANEPIIQFWNEKREVIKTIDR